MVNRCTEPRVYTENIKFCKYCGYGLSSYYSSYGSKIGVDYTDFNFKKIPPRNKEY